MLALEDDNNLDLTLYKEHLREENWMDSHGNFLSSVNDAAITLQVYIYDSFTCPLFFPRAWRRANSMSESTWFQKRSPTEISEGRSPNHF